MGWARLGPKQLTKTYHLRFRNHSTLINCVQTKHCDSFEH